MLNFNSEFKFNSGCSLVSYWDVLSSMAHVLGRKPVNFSPQPVQMLKARCCLPEQKPANHETLDQLPNISGPSDMVDDCQLCSHCYLTPGEGKVSIISKGMLPLNQRK